MNKILRVNILQASRFKCA